ncbi:MAG: oxygen-independent coproporphyrinogen III oxidase [Wolinella sp.]
MQDVIDFEKFARYSKAGPRYTSYPTANEFHEGFSVDDYIVALSREDSSRALSLYVHLPFCRSACYFCGCNVIYTSKEDKKSRYIGYLKKELALLKQVLDTNRIVTQLHFGGGTPTFMDAEQLALILALIHETFPNFALDAELSCEIDPRFFAEEQMRALKNGGINRLSFGVQDFDSNVQEAIHRAQSVELVEEAVNLARQYGINSINFDLIYGLPYQGFESFKATLNEVVKLNPDRLAIFNYAHVPWMKKTMRKIDETTLPAPEEKLRILQYTIGFLKERGYEMIGMDHFAKRDDELFRAIQKGELRRNFQGYTTKGGSQTIGIGLTSIGEGGDYYAQNYKEMEAYERALDDGRLPIHKGIVLNSDDIVRKDVIMQLMSNFKLDFKEIELRHKIDFKSYFGDSLSELGEYEAAGLCEISEHGIRISPTGSMLVRNIAMVFDAFLKKTPILERKFSKTV